MDREIATLEAAGTWTEVPCPSDKNVVGSKWVFRIKRKADGTIDKYKARLVARRFTQIYGPLLNLQASVLYWQLPRVMIGRSKVSTS
jgi:hypothetical protein